MFYSAHPARKSLQLVLHIYFGGLLTRINNSYINTYIHTRKCREDLLNVPYNDNHFCLLLLQMVQQNTNGAYSKVRKDPFGVKPSMLFEG